MNVTIERDSATRRPIIHLFHEQEDFTSTISVDKQVASDRLKDSDNLQGESIIKKISTHATNGH